MFYSIFYFYFDWIILCFSSFFIPSFDGIKGFLFDFFSFESEENILGDFSILSIMTDA